MKWWTWVIIVIFVILIVTAGAGYLIVSCGNTISNLPL